MNIDAKTIQAACEAGLVLCGQDEGRPEFIGTEKQWSDYHNMLMGDEVAKQQNICS